MNPNQSTIDSLRRMADFLEQHSVRHNNGFYGANINVFAKDKDDLIAMTRGMGKLEKHTQDQFFFLRKEFGGGLAIDFVIARDAVCERVVTQVVEPATEEVVIPAKPERVVEKVEWICPDSLLAPRVPTFADVKNESQLELAAS